MDIINEGTNETKADDSEPTVKATTAALEDEDKSDEEEDAKEESESENEESSEGEEELSQSEAEEDETGLRVPFKRLTNRQKAMLERRERGEGDDALISLPMGRCCQFATPLIRHAVLTLKQQKAKPKKR